MLNKFIPYSIRLLTWWVIGIELGVFLIAFNVYFFIFDGNDEARLENPEYLWLLLILPFFAVLWIFNVSSKNENINYYASTNKLGSFGVRFSTTQSILRYFMLRNVIFFLIIALVNPQYGKGKLEAKREGIDLIVALDVSNSMLAEDLSEGRSRLKHAKLAIERLINRLKGDRIGLVVFAGDAFVQFPITNDYGSAKLFLSSVNTNMLSAQGTAIGRAIDKSVTSFDPKSPAQKAIIIISDGENHEDDALSSAKLAAENKIHVHTIGVGSLNGSPIPVYDNGERKGVKRDEEGNTIITRLNPQMLKEVAEAGSGEYIHATKANFGLEPLFNSIAGMERKAYESVSYTDYEDQFHYFIWIAMLMLIIEFIFGYLPVIKA